MAFIDKEKAIESLDSYAQDLYQQGEWNNGKTAHYCATLLESVPDKYVVCIEEWNKLKFECNVLKALLKGEWVRCRDAMEALNITFDQGIKMFQFCVTGAWPTSEDNVSFRISEHTIAQTKTKDFEEDFKLQEMLHMSKVDTAASTLELILEQQGGIL
jgi:hypothetical protein